MTKKAKRRRGRKQQRRQFAALPYCQDNSEIRVLLVTSRETRRWILPKGWPEKKLSGPQVAEKEAMEEAGLIGEMSTRSIGYYSYLKRLRDGRGVVCGVDVFPMRVSQLLDDWPERHERERRWFSLAQAALAVDEGELVTLLLRLAAPPVNVHELAERDLPAIPRG